MDSFPCQFQQLLVNCVNIKPLAWLSGFLLLLSFTTQSQETIYLVGEPSLTYFAADETSDSGVAIGLDALFLTHLLEGLGFKVKSDVLPWSRAYQFALEKPNTLIHSIARNDEREDRFQWVEAYMELDYGLYSYGKEVRFNIRSRKDLDRFTLAAQRDDGLYYQLQKMGLRRIQTVLHYDMLYSLLSKGRVDMIPASRETTSIRCEQLNMCDKLQLEYSLSHINGTLYLAFNNKTNVAIVKKVREAFRQKVHSGEYLHFFPMRKVQLQFTQ